MTRDFTRRGLLKASAVGCIGGVATGCVGREAGQGEEDEPNRESENGGASRTGSGADDRTEPEPTPTANAEVTSSTIITDGEGTNWIQAEIQNPTDVSHGRAKVNHTVYDGSGGVVTTQQSLVDFIPPGETWQDFLIVLGQRRDEAASVETELLTDDGQVGASRIRSVNVVDSTLNQGYRSGTEITGRIENTANRNYPQLYLVGLVYDQNGDLRGSVGNIMRDVAAGEERAFRAATVGNSTPADRESELPTRHEVLVFDNIP
jgi:hypothetical protein